MELWPMAHPAPLLQVPHRLLTLMLLPGLELCLLCGPRPPLSQLDPQVNSGHVPLSPITPATRHSRFPALLPPPFLPKCPLFCAPHRAVFPPPSPRLGSSLNPSPCIQASPYPRSLCLLPLWASTLLRGHHSLTTPLAASGPLVAANAGLPEGLPAAGTPSSARGLPPAQGHPRVGLGWRGGWVGVLIPSSLVNDMPFPTGCCSSIWS